ncbi:MAG: preprotein translocase subunit SecE [Peptococcaceae bacterium]|nr:preprotein translocase subunit SecE [Peptococcaceae bacterium]
MALIKKTDKDENGRKLPAARGETAVKKKEAGRKPVPKADNKKAVQVKKETAGRLERAKSYFRGVYSELKKVHWPTRREVVIYTSVVVVAVIIVGVLIWIFDSLMSRVIQLLIR